METRTIAIANNKTQRRYTIETSAETLGQLKAQMREQGIDYTGMTFTEGITKTQLLTDDSLLPTNVMYKGALTNNLVMLLTNPNKQIASGGYPTNRKEFGAYIKQNNLGEAIKAKFGDNWTRISTDNLINFFAAQGENNNEALEKTREELNNFGRESEEEVNTHAEKNKGIIFPDVKTAPHANTVNWFYDGVKAMFSDNLLHVEDVIVLASLTTELAMHLWETKPIITNDDIDDMMASIQ